MKRPRFRLTMRRMMIVIVIIACSVRFVLRLDYRGWEHHYLHRSERCGCIQRDITEFPWPERVQAQYHSRMADFCKFIADGLGQPPVHQCGVPILDPIPGEFNPPDPKSAPTVP